MVNLKAEAYIRRASSLWPVAKSRRAHHERLIASRLKPSPREEMVGVSTAWSSCGSATGPSD